MANHERFARAQIGSRRSFGAALGQRTAGTDDDAQGDRASGIRCTPCRNLVDVQAHQGQLAR